MNKEYILSLPNKIAAFAFILMVLASFCFIGYRIATKSAYTAKELKQTQILSLSVVELLSDKIKNEPDMWDKFKSDEFVLATDYKKIEGNWVIAVKIKKFPGFVEAESTVNSGWNSREPQKTVITGRIFSDGNVVYTDKEKTDLLKTDLQKITVKKTDKILIFGFPDEIKQCPVKIEAIVTKFKDSSGNALLALKPAESTDKAKTR